MQNDILSILNESEGLNAKVFSLVRLKLLASLAALGPDGATYRELKAALDINDGVLFANLNVLKDMGYLTSEKITSEGKELELYTITTEGQDEWKRTQSLAVQVPPLRSMIMEKRKKVIAFFKELGFAFDISRFDDRLIAQKLVCLLELKGIDLGYSCSLYVRGPYSPDLTQDLFAFTREFENLETDVPAEYRRERDRRRARQDLRAQTRPARSRRNLWVLCTPAELRSARSTPAGQTAETVLFRGPDCPRYLKSKRVPLQAHPKGSRRSEKGDRYLAEGFIKITGALIDEERRYLARGSVRCKRT